MRTPMLANLLTSLTLTGLMLWTTGCGDSGTASNDGTGGGGGGSDSSGTFLDGGTGDGNVGWYDDGDAEVCAAQTATGKLRPVYLAFAFDVSGSMGQQDYPWHDPELKWEPVVKATEAFFADVSSTGIVASLTFFPALSDKCESSTYETPDVPMTPLPSSLFQDAITAITPQTEEDWRGGTPTLAVLRGTFDFLEAFAQTDPNAIFAVVLVTDGQPSGCGDNSIASVVDEVTAQASEFPTYVIGVENPPIQNAPDTVSDLGAVAVAGGTSAAFMIETGDPEGTKTAFSTAINEIRGQATPCNIPIPDPPTGQVFDRSKVRVLFTPPGGKETAFVYDPTCEQENAWYYDDVNAPKTIVLCPSTCNVVSSDLEVEISVEFGCVDVIDIK